MNQAFAMGVSEESVVAPVLRTRSGSSPSHSPLHSSYYQESASTTPRSRFSPEYSSYELELEARPNGQKVGRLVAEGRHEARARQVQIRRAKEKEDFMILTTDVSNRTPQVKAAPSMFAPSS